MAFRLDFDACHPGDDQPRIGWTCSYTPEELILAAGFVPVRIGSDEKPPEGAEAFLPPNICPYIRSLFDSVRAGPLDVPDGIVFVYSCDAMRRLADAWNHYIKLRFVYRLDVPRRADARAEDFFVSQLESLKLALEGETGRKITSDDLEAAVSTLNSTRELVLRISRLRSNPDSPLTGSEFFAIARAAVRSDRERFNTEAMHIVSELERQKEVPKGLPRLLLCGCVVDSPALHALAEECGAAIVAEDLCTSLRHFEELVDTSLEPLRGIARRYLQRPACARMTGVGDRVGNALKLAREYSVSGVVFHTLKFCDLVQADLPRMSEAFEREDFPFLHIDRDYSTASDGQLRTRLGAFVELIRNREVS